MVRAAQLTDKTKFFLKIMLKVVLQTPVQWQERGCRGGRVNRKLRNDCSHLWLVSGNLFMCLCAFREEKPVTRKREPSCVCVCVCVGYNNSTE